MIKLENISKTYASGNAIFEALKHINLEIQSGEFTSIIGASGSGKSTLMNILGLLDHASTGNYYFEQRDISQVSEREQAHIRNTKIGFVFQSFFLLSRSTALQNVMLPLFYGNTPRQEAKDKAYSMLEKVGLDKFAHHRPSQLSGGQQQRVAIARALVNSPQVILADEPTGALDSKTSLEVMKIFSDLHRQEGRSIVIITHDKEVSKRTERVITIKDGNIQ